MIPGDLHSLISGILSRASKIMQGFVRGVGGMRRMMSSGSGGSKAKGVFVAATGQHHGKTTVNLPVDPCEHGIPTRIKKRLVASWPWRRGVITW